MQSNNIPIDASRNFREVADTTAWNQLWAMEPQSLRNMLNSSATIMAGTNQAAKAKAPYGVVNGVAVISLVGPISKYQSMFSSASTLDVESQIQNALENDDITAITLVIDSPGGTVAGTDDLARLIRTSKLVKPINAFISDNCQSAAYWIASACTTITANEGAFVGSIGCYSVLTDTSNAATAAGVQVHLVSAGEYKGLLEPGLVIDDKALSEVQDVVNAAYDLFVNSVARGRNLPISAVKQLADGRTHVASMAKSLGLIDAIGTLQTTLKGEQTTMSNDTKTKASADTTTAAPADNGSTVTDGEKQILAALSSLTELVKQLMPSDDGADDSSDGEVADDDGGDDVDACVQKAVATDRARLKAISDAIDNKDVAFKAFLEGKSVTEAKAMFADLLQTENVELKKKVKGSARGIDALAIAPKAPAESSKGSDKDKNDLETIWANNIDGVQESFSGKKDLFFTTAKYKQGNKLAISGTHPKGEINV